LSTGLNIIVCIKQVLETTEVEFDKETGRLKREGIAAIINPFDEYAIETGLRIKEKSGGLVKVLSMGPPNAEQALRDAIALGADEAYLATDHVFAGADTWATGYTLAKCVQKIGEFDIIICGLKTTDGDTGQTGPEMAEVLDVPCICYVNEIISIKDGIITLKRSLDEGIELLETKLPLVITVSKDIAHPRLATLRGRIAAKKAVINQLTNKELDLDVKTIGLEGSFTRVIKIFTPQINFDGEIIQGNPNELADAIFYKLKEVKVI